MFPDHLFHPYHIVPSSKFISALMKFSDHLIAHMSMKLDTVFRQIFVFLLWISDAGVKVEKMLLSGNPFDFLIKTSPDSGFSHGVLHIDGYFCRPVIGSPTLKRGEIGESYNLFSPL